MSSMICPMTGSWCGSTGCLRDQCSLRAAKERDAARVTLDLSWSSRSFNMGAAFGFVLGAMMGGVVALSIFH